VSDKKGIIRQLQDEFTQVQVKLDHDKHTRRVNDLMQYMIKQRLAQTAMHKKITELEQQGRQISSLKDINTNHESNTDNLKADIRMFQFEIESKDQQIETLQDEIKTLNKNLNNALMLMED